MQFVFPSPMYPWLQEQLNESNVFTQEARLERQTWSPSSHSSISLLKKRFNFSQFDGSESHCQFQEKLKSNSTEEKLN